MNDNRRATSIYLIAALVIAMGALAWRLQSARTLLGRERSEKAESMLYLAAARSERNEVIELLNRTELERPFLVGTDIASGERVTIDQPIDGVYYLMRVTCPFCGQNDSTLRAMSNTGIPLFIVAVDSDSASLATWLDSHPIGARAFVRVSGGLIKRLPTRAVPRTFVVRSGAIREFVTGVLDSLSARTIVSAAIAP